MHFATDLISDLQHHWHVYALMPVMAAVIGYVTKLVAVEMMFRPLEFRGIKPYLGWQGIVPRNVARMAVTAIDLMVGKLLDPQELIDRIDLDEVMKTLQEPLLETVDELTRELMAELQPAVWEAMPRAAQQAVVNRVRSSLPTMLQRLKSEMAQNIDLVLDVRGLAVDALVRDKALTVRLIRTVGRNEMRFIVRIGIPFGFALGLVQAVTWALTHSPWIMPGFGAFTGLITDYIALQMIFRPVEPRGVGRLRWQGLFHARRHEVQHDYSELMAREILTPANLMTALMSGPRSDRFFWLVGEEVQRAIDEQVRYVRPLIKVTVGEPWYLRTRERMTGRVLAQLAERENEMAGYADQLFDLPAMLSEKMDKLSSSDYEGLLRPAFKQDEWKLVAVGAALGFLIGELQVHLLLN